jgi:DnaJ-class molecular chaperone
MIKKSFKKLSLELHPDKNRSPGAVERYLSVKTAYEV